VTKHQRSLRHLLTTIAEQAGARLIGIQRTGGGHVRASFDRGGPLFMASTPSDVRAIRNFKAQARRVLR